jgi:hypothetical protein
VPAGQLQKRLRRGLRDLVAPVHVAVYGEGVGHVRILVQRRLVLPRRRLLHKVRPVVRHEGGKVELPLRLDVDEAYASHEAVLDVVEQRLCEKASGEVVGIRIGHR